MTENKLDDSGDLPGKRDPLFLNAQKIVFQAERGSTALLQRHLRIGYGRAAALLDAMVRERYIGELDGSTRTRPIFDSAFGALPKERYFSSPERREHVRNERVRLLNSSEHLFVEQFVKRYGEMPKFDELSKLTELLHSRGFDFSRQEVSDILILEVDRSKQLNVKLRIVSANPSNSHEMILSYLNFFRPDDVESPKVLVEILEGRDLFSEFGDNPGLVVSEVMKVHRGLELESFEKRLLASDETILHIGDVDILSGYEFEEFLSTLFSRMGYLVEQTRLSGDQGADLVVVKFGERSVIQAKRFKGSVGNSAVQEIVAAISLYEAERGKVITNSYFTLSAKELAAANNIELIDRDLLENLIRNHW